ncbi:uncharacterized protein LOC143067302 isoform X2 [Mytilus galloprovincialis]|uniref:uncharacterized protein LOC143067302 isoform X2 n=1 Tax=Mytilus galloprovincialis TaxID=29158 RepID=UPI003F7BAA9E
MNGHSDNPDLEDMDLHLNLESLDTNKSHSHNFEMSDESSEWEDDPMLMNQEVKKEKLPDELSINLQGLSGAEGSDNDKQHGGLLPYEDGIDVDSDEEKEIMKEIKDEIQKQIRGEMKSELELYQAKVAALEAGSSRAEESDRDTGQEDMDPKMKEAILKMRKLDRILSKKIKREREVKKDRMILERRIKSELEGINQQNHDVKLNTEKFLALTLPPSHNEGIKLSDLPDEPVFATQLNEQDYPNLKSGGAKSKGNSSRSETSQSAKSTDRDTMSASDTTSMNGSTKGSKKHKKKKDFIKRNKELAADAENPIPMTQEEKDRVESLLTDLDQLPEITEDENVDEFRIPRFELAVHSGEGFVPDDDDQKSLRNIESRLKEIMPPEDFESVMHTPSTPQSYKLFTPVSIKSNMDIEHFGEKALLEYKDQRELRERLFDVDEQLSNLSNRDEDELSEISGVLPRSQLNNLLDQCARSISRTSYSDLSSRVSEADSESTLCNSSESTPRTPKSCREMLMENPPKLSEDVLHKLLTDAHTALPSRLSTLREEDENDDEIEKTFVEDVSSRVERWRKIREDNEMYNDVELSNEISGVLSEQAESARSERWKKIQELLMNIENEDNENDNSQTDRPYTERPSNEPSQQTDSIQEYSSRTVEETNGSETDIYQEWVPSENYPKENVEPVYSMNEPFFQRKNQVLKSDSFSLERSDLVNSDSKTPFLPEINRSGSLVYQDYSRVSSAQSGRSSASSVRTNIYNSKHQDSIEIMSIDGECITPRPPDSERPSSSKSRTVTPLNR